MDREVEGNQMNNWNMDHERKEDQVPAGSVFPDQADSKSERKNGFGKGAFFGAFAAVLIGWAAFNVFELVTGNRILITSKGNASILSGDDSLLDAEAVSKINELTAYIDTYYYDETEKEALKDGLYNGLLGGIGDKYSVYYNSEEYKQQKISTTGKYHGIGAGLKQDKDTMAVSVKKVYKGTPSEEAGLRSEDIILSVDGIDAASMEVTELVKLIRGEEGSTVHLEVYRESTKETLSLDVKRANVTLPSVEHEMLSDGIGYIRIESFESDTAKQFETAVDELEARNLKSLIVDLRYNGGGLVDAVVQILDDILPEGLLVYTEDKYGSRQEYKSAGDTHMDYPMAVLVNEGSASASEIFAGAIKDYGYGTLIGTKTFGKGIVQTIFTLEDGDAVKLTTAKYFTPKGNYIHGVGIEPDIVLEYEYLDPDGTEYEMKYDNQLQKAIEVLKGESL